MFGRLSEVFSREGRVGLVRTVSKQKTSWAQKYLTASDESAFGPLTHILKSEPYSTSKDRHVDCNLTPGAIEAASAKSASDFEWPIFQDKAHSKFLKKFMFSFKNIYTDNINSSNLMFVTGPTKCGKSVLLR